MRTTTDVMKVFIFLAFSAFVSIVSATDDVVSCISIDADASTYCTAVLRGVQYLDTAPTGTVTAVMGEVTVTATVIRSVYITNGPTSTIYSSSVVLTTIHRTVTTYVSQASAALQKTPASCDTSSALAALYRLGGNDLWTLCSSLGALPTPTTLASVVAASSTVTQADESNVTSTITGEVRFTVVPSTTIVMTMTSSVTETSTITLAAPTFTHVWGPKPGCADLRPDTNESLAPSMVKREAVSTCQASCARRSSDSF